MVVGDGRADGYYLSLLEGLAQVRDRLPQAMFFLEAVGRDQHRLWQAAEQLGLLGQVSLVAEDPDNRELLFQADVVIQPQPGGVVRPLVLEAMVYGRPVIATADGMIDYTESLRQLVETEYIDLRTAYNYAPNAEELKMAMKGIRSGGAGILG